MHYGERKPRKAGEKPMGVEYDDYGKLIKAKTPRGGRAVMCAYCGNGIVILNDHKESCVIWDVI